MPGDRGSDHDQDHRHSRHAVDGHGNRRDRSPHREGDQAGDHGDDHQ